MKQAHRSLLLFAGNEVQTPGSIQHATDAISMDSTMLKVAIFERDRKTAEELRDYIKHFFYGEVEVVDGSSSDKLAITEMKKFKPEIFIIGQMGNPQADNSELTKHPEKFEIERHIEACKLVLASYEKRPYLVAICGDDSYTTKQFQRYRGRCEEWGYDSVYRRKEVNSAAIGFWINRARRSGGASK